MERGMACITKMEYQVFLCIIQKNSAMATFFHFLQTKGSHSKVCLENAKKKSEVWYYEKWMGRQASFPP